MLRAAVAAAVALFVTCACGARAATWRSSWTAPGAAFQGAERESFEAARAALDAGRRSEALERLRRLGGEASGNLEIGAWVQDLEALLLEAGVDVFAPRFSLRADPPDDVLRRAYGARAADAPTAPSLVLAARAETDV
ncbi:MAG: hypothetical protein AAFP86_21945, partial [Planctomycetota bacterium]